MSDPTESEDPEERAARVAFGKKTRPRSQAAMLAQGAALGAAVAGPLAAIFTHEGPIPIETLDWIIRNGSMGLALVIIFILGAFAIWMIRDRMKSDDARREEIIDAKTACAIEIAQVKDKASVKEERLFRELIDARRGGDRLATAAEALEKLLAKGTV